MDEDLMGIDRAILDAIRGSKQPLSTYGIAKDVRVSWSTVNTHCYKLKSMGILSEQRQQSRFGQSKMLWHLKAK